MDQSLINLIQKGGLSNKQARVYLALLQLGQASISQIAESAQLKRPNTYGIISELEAIGYAHRTAERKKKTYRATDPNRIVNELKQSTRSFEEMLPYLRNIQAKAGKPTVQYYTGIEGAKEAHSQIYRPKEARYLSSIEQAERKIPDEVSRWQKTYFLGRARPGGKHLLTDTPKDREYANSLRKSKQLVRYLPSSLELNADIALVDNTVFITSFEDIIQTTVIKSRATYAAFCTLYDLAWSDIASG